MEYSNYYQYNTFEEAQQAVDLCNTFYNIPEAPDNVTRTWVEYQFANLNNPQFYYILFNDTLPPVLGLPTGFGIIVKPPMPLI
jgi:hypothetical protein